MVKHATEGERCRFADLAELRPFTAPATVFVSHSWGGQWGDLVGACASGGRGDRVVWLDVLAVRQWPGNGGDLDFRGVVKRCKAFIVAAAPIPGRISEKMMEIFEVKAYAATVEYNADAKIIPFARLWCVGKKKNKIVVLGISSSPTQHFPNNPFSMLHSFQSNSSLR